MNFDIRYHVWNIFEIYRANKLSNIYVAAEMLISNVQFGLARYKGATQVDYFDCMKRYVKDSHSVRASQKLIFEKLMARHGDAITNAWKNHNRELMNQICLMDIIEYKTATSKR